MRLTRLLENLDDKDTFAHDCYYCDDQRNSMIPDMDEFHTAHTAARQAAEKAGEYGTTAYKKVYEDSMYVQGFKYRGASLSAMWVKAPVTENLDDKDTFGLDCTYIGCDRRPDHDEFHAAHEAAKDAAMSATTIFPYQTYYGLDRGYKKEYKGNRQYWNNFVAAMAKQGYKLSAGEFIKEDLDDKDEFTKDPGCGGGCPLSDHPNDWYKQFNRDESFHDAHESAHEAAIRAMGNGDRNERWSRYATTAIDKMREFGYRLANPLESDLRKAPLENWLFTKLSIKESLDALDDKDEFSSGLVATGKIKAHNSYAGTEWVLMFDTNPPTGVQEQIIYASPREVFGRFPKHVVINNIRFDAETIMDMDGTIGFYDDGDIRELEE